MAPQGRPRKQDKDAHLTTKPFKPRKPHNLSLNIANCTHNAKCHWMLSRWIISYTRDTCTV